GGRVPGGPPARRRLLADDPPRAPGRYAVQQPGAHHPPRQRLGNARPIARRAEIASMKVLVTGSAGHLGEALVRTLQSASHEVVSLDRTPSPLTSNVGSVADRSCVRQCLRGVEAVFHAATLHKPHVVTHSRQDFVDTNITGTLNLLEEAMSAGVASFVFTSTTSAFGGALTPPAGAPAAWVTEDVRSIPRNIYGVTKVAAEDLCEL